MSTRSRRSSIDGRRVFLCILALIVAGAPAVARETAETDPTVLEAREVLADRDYQTELPGATPDDIRVPPTFGVIAEVLLWLMLAVGVVLIIMWVVNEFFLGAGSLDDPDGPLVADGAGASEDGLLADPERLAREGRFEEAIHVLLLSAIRHLGASLPTPPRPSNTSRELQRLLPLDRDGRDAFAELVRQVELSLFGGFPAGAEQYDRCRRCFKALVAG